MSNHKYKHINIIGSINKYIPSTFDNFYNLSNSGATAGMIGILLGYKKIVLLGCDCNYIEQIPESKLIDNKSKTLQITETPNNNPNYWFNDYQEKGDIYSVPDGNTLQMKGWKQLLEAGKFHNVEITNGSKISKIPYFKKINLNYSIIKIEPKISFYNGRNKPQQKNTGINKICDYIFENLSNYLNYSIIDNYKETSDIVISTYDKLDDNYNRCRIIIVHDLIYLYNKDKTDNIDQYNKIHNILSSLRKNDFIIFTTKYQQNKYLEYKDKYDFKVSKENTDILYLPYRFKETRISKVYSKKYDFFILIQSPSRKNPYLYEKYIEKLINFKFCVIISNQICDKKYLNIYEKKNNVDLFCNTNDDEFLELILKSKYCLYLTDDEGTGLHAIECIYNNCIPIVKNNINFNELLGENCYYLNNIYDVNKSIIQINDIVKKDEKTVNLYSDIFKKFNIHYCCKQTKKIINNFYSIYQKNIREGIVVIGNGPSLRDFDFTKLSKLNSIGMNIAFRYWRKINWYPTYYCCMDSYVIQHHAKDIEELVNDKTNHIQLFFLKKCICRKAPNLKNNKRVIFWEDICKDNAFEGEHYTTGSLSVRFAIYLGFKKIYIIGIDGKYIEKIKECEHLNGTKLKITEDISHNPNYFFDGYQKKGDLYNIPNPEIYNKDICNCVDCNGKPYYNTNVHTYSLECIQNCILRNKLEVNIYNSNKQSYVKYFRFKELPI